MLGSGEINLTEGAKFPLHIAMGLQTPQMRVKPGAQFQEIVEAKGRLTRRRPGKRVRRHDIRQIGGQRQQVALGAVIEDPVLAPVPPTGDQHILNALKRMEGMGDPEPDRSTIGMTCS